MQQIRFQIRSFDLNDLQVLARGQAADPKQLQNLLLLAKLPGHACHMYERVQYMHAHDGGPDEAAACTTL